MNTIGDRLKGRSILIVDDDSRNTFALVSYLDGMEMNIYTATDGYQAIELLDGPGNIEMILMDMMMPEMDGYETIGRIRNNRATAAIPIIALTAKAMKGDRDKCLEAGASEYVSKPVNMKELLEKMANMLNPV
ncbi:MAG TPA: response regulator [Puia sp.]|nr:response regulator [Puia sp.]